MISASDRSALTPALALDALMEGNRRFVSGKPRARELKRELADTASGQWPFAAVLSCIDSRVSAELVFDQGIGDIFSTRVGGNVVTPDVLGGLEFACKVIGAKLILVLGHTDCGAVKGACDGVQFGHLGGLLARLAPAVSAAAEELAPEPRDSTHAGFVQTTAIRNVRLGMRALRTESSVLVELIDAGEIAVAGGLYDVASGRVELIDA